MRSEIFLLLAFVSITSSHQSALRRQNVLAVPPNNTSNQGLEDQQTSPDLVNNTTAIFPQIRSKKILRATSGIITSKNYPQKYPNNFENTDTISVDDGDRIEIKFLEFELEGDYGYGQCYYDWLTITEESGETLLPKTCGSSTPALIASNSNRVLINFNSDYSVTRKGFKIEWKTIPSSPPCFCGLKPKSTRIVGGSETEVNEYPWMAIVKSRTFCGDWGPCGGSLLNNQWVITAAHCIGKTKPEENQVDLGQHDLVEDTSKVLIMLIQKIINHPQYDKEKFDFDFSLIKLSSKVDFSLHTHVRPICLPYNSRSRTIRVAGWGMVSSKPEEKCQDRLRETSVRTYTNTDCKKWLGNDITPQMLCAKGQSSDACFGDSGGPLMQSVTYSCPSSRRCNFWELIGVVSWGPDKCEDPQPGVYARVTSVLDWIKNNIEGDGSVSCTRPNL